MVKASGELERVTSLPPAYGECWASVRARISLPPGGEAFLYLDPSGPVLLGFLDRSILWDVRSLLENATLFSWDASSQ